MHPLLALIAIRPQLLVAHIDAYGALVAAECGEASACCQRKLMPGAVALAGDTADLALQPVARQHPFRLVLGAAAAGAALTALRPWRWVNRSTLTRAVLLGLLPQMVSRLRTPATGEPSWLAHIAALAQVAPTPHSTPHHASRFGS